MTKAMTKAMLLSVLGAVTLSFATAPAFAAQHTSDPMMNCDQFLALAPADQDAGAQSLVSAGRDIAMAAANSNASTGSSSVTGTTATEGTTSTDQVVLDVVDSDSIDAAISTDSSNSSDGIAATDTISSADANASTDGSTSVASSTDGSTSADGSSDQQSDVTLALIAVCTNSN